MNSPVDRQFITEVLMIPISKQKQSIKAQQLVSRGEILQEQLCDRDLVLGNGKVDLLFDKLVIYYA